MNTVLLLGDSQADGIRAALERLLAARGYALSAGSWTETGASLAEISAHVPQDRLHRDLALVVTGGGNDSGVAEHPDAYRTKLEQLAQELRLKADEVVLVGPMRSADDRVARLHDAARAVQARGIRGARWIDGYTLSGWAQHSGDGTHFTRNGYAVIAAELDRAIWGQGAVTAVGLVGTLVLLGAVGVIAAEAWLGAPVAD